MPIYEYQCTVCGHRLENMQKISDPLLMDCPKCNEPTLRKLMSATSLVKSHKIAQMPPCGEGACSACLPE